MLIDARELPDGHSLACDVCIIGGGAAGMTLAVELRKTGKKVIVLESGGLVSEPRTQALYEGRQEGELTPPDSNYLATTRLRFLGGSTNHWDGWCRPLDAIDFEERAWVPHSGWPLTRADLDPFYERAAPYVYIKPFEAKAQERDRAPFLFPDQSACKTTLFHISPPTRFIHYRKEFESSAEVDIVLQANVLDLALRPSGSSIERVVIGLLDGKRMELRARDFVLATGGIENARLLLASNGVQKSGVGNGRDLVGRYFMDHPGIENMGQVVLPSRGALMALYFITQDRAFKHRIVGVLSLSAEEQRKRRLLNGLVVLRRLNRWERPPLGDEVLEMSEASDRARRRATLPEGAGDALAKIGFTAEPEPSPESRIVLGSERDELGMPRTELRWHITRSTVESALRSIREFARLLGLEAIGRARLTHPETDRFRGATWSHHHMGTTRMSSDPSRGVVDADCRVHGVDNLFVAGSSVFPTVGCSNPTVTIVALAVRLADHLKGRLAA